MSAQFGFSHSTWNNYERGTSKPALDDLIKICNFFGVDEYTILHSNLTTLGDFSKLFREGKNRTSHDFAGDFQGDFRPKKYKSYDISSTTNKTEETGAIYHRIPQVITVDSRGDENVVMVHIKARAGYLNGYADPEFIENLPAYRLPGLNNGTFRIFEVEGLSMYPTLHSGDLVIGSFVDQLRVLRDDRVHVVVTKNEGVVVKRVLNRIDKDGKLILNSDNLKERDMYPPLVIDPGDVLEVWYAIGFISRQMRPPAEVYNRVIDLEGRLTILENKVKKSR